MTTDTDTPPVPYAWLITLQIPIGGGMRTFTTNGIYGAAPGATRTSIYQSIRAHLTEQNPDLANANVLFFSLEPDQL